VLYTKHVGATAGRFFGRVLAIIFDAAQPPLDSSVYALVRTHTTHTMHVYVNLRKFYAQVGTAAVMGGFSSMTIALVVIL
jgi:H+/Cl- antiporter ClcA